MFSTGGLWLIPLVLAFTGGLANIRFILTWLAYSAGNGWMVLKAMERPLQHETPAYLICIRWRL
jgi:hypothetical protein